jgi:HSP20 family protein
MRLTLSRDPITMMNRINGALSDENFFDWDDTQLDMYEEEDKVIVKLKAPGFDEKNVEISVEDNTLTITGQAELEEEESDKSRKYYKREIRSQSFTRSVALPTGVVAEEAEANFKNGILHITMPKAEESKPKKISVKASR